MSRRTILLAFVLVAVMGLSATTVLAQDATAPIPSAWGVPGFETLSTISDPSLAPGMVLELGRLTWEPGFTIEMHTHPATDAIYVLSGSVAWSIENGTAEVKRAMIDGTPGPTEVLQPGGEVVLEAGDAITFDYAKTDMLHAARVVGDAPVVMLLATIYDPSKPLTVFPEGSATPAA
jgi:hypothetical protein